jgi:hypothetical protein
MGFLFILLFLFGAKIMPQMREMISMLKMITPKLIAYQIVDAK